LPFALKSILRQKKKNYGKLKKDFECQVWTANLKTQTNLGTKVVGTFTLFT
jgi:hypothetical protein